MEHFTPIASLIGGALIGASAALLLLGSGRIAGISGIVGGLMMSEGRGKSEFWRALFVIGLVLGAWLAAQAGFGFGVEIAAGWPTIIVAGLLVGFGTRMGGGCTSGHGVCGLARFSKRSLAATLTFMAAGMATVFVLRHVMGG
jgi:uncharacterized membrane protein YedE/YeeE